SNKARTSEKTAPMMLPCTHSSARVAVAVSGSEVELAFVLRKGRSTGYPACGTARLSPVVMTDTRPVEARPLQRTASGTAQSCGAHVRRRRSRCARLTSITSVIGV
ncbi:MAG: hypothetical protein QOG46_1413, partial [Pseudonocardiales bacterium]|nr:hypothetical protein [Pseudonocardiales bacterium]